MSPRKRLETVVLPASALLSLFFVVIVRDTLTTNESLKRVRTPVRLLFEHVSIHHLNVATCRAARMYAIAIPWQSEDAGEEDKDTNGTGEDGSQTLRRPRAVE